MVRGQRLLQDAPPAGKPGPSGEDGEACSPGELNALATANVGVVNNGGRKKTWPPVLPFSPLRLPDMAAELSIVIGTLNRLDQLRACIDSIRAQTSAPLVIHVSDAGSSDGTVEYLQSIADDTVRPVFAGERLGQARAYNEMFALVQTPFVCWLSDDNVVVDRGLDVALKALRDNPRLGMVGLKVKDQRGPFQRASYQGGVSTIGVLTVNQGLLRTDVLRAVGGFSEVFRDYGIDPDLTAKVLFSGWDVALTKRVAVHHFRNWSEQKDTPEYWKLRLLHERYLLKYDAKYCRLSAPGLGHALRRGAYRRLVKCFPKALHINNPVEVFGYCARDLFNICNARYIGAFDVVANWSKNYYLVQHCPPGLLPAELPPDPPPFADEAPAAEDMMAGATVQRLLARLQESEGKARSRADKDRERIAELKALLAKRTETAARLRRTRDELKKRVRE